MEDNQGCLVGVLVLSVIIGLCIAFPVFLYIGIVLITLIIIGIIIVFLYNKQKKNKERNQSISTGITVGMVNDSIFTYEKDIQSLRRNIYKMHDTTIRTELDALTQKMRKILKILRDDPTDFKKTRRFMDSLLSSLQPIVSQGVQLYSANDTISIDTQTIDDLREGFSLINQACDNHIKKMYDNNLMDLDVELTVLKKSLRSRGLLDNESEDL
jgi:5-bromo-4-chloroindolyl phosphate hydrolysis protein